MWTKYFKLVKLRPGRVITPSHGEIDFSRDDIPVETCKELFEKDFLYLEITEEGKRELYGIEEKEDLKEINEIKEVKEEEPIFEPLPSADENPNELIPVEIGMNPIGTSKKNNNNEL